MRLKSKLIFLLLFGFGALMSAQENPNEPVAQQPKPLIPSIGTYMVEVNLKPFSSRDVISINNLYAKYFVNNSLAVRLGLKISSKSNILTKDDWDVDEKYPSSTIEKSSYFGVNPGFEYHFLKNSKISPYAGFELSLGRKNSNARYEYYNTQMNYSTGKDDYIYVNEEIEGGWISTVANSYVDNNGVLRSYVSKSYTFERAFTSFGFNVLFGSNFYFVKNMYFGFELGLGYTHFENSWITVDNSLQVNRLNIPSSSSTSLNINYNNAIRFGVWF